MSAGENLKFLHSLIIHRAPPSSALFTAPRSSKLISVGEARSDNLPVVPRALRTIKQERVATITPRSDSAQRVGPRRSFLLVPRRYAAQQRRLDCWARRAPPEAIRAASIPWFPGFTRTDRGDLGPRRQNRFPRSRGIIAGIGSTIVASTVFYFHRKCVGAQWSRSSVVNMITVTGFAEHDLGPRLGNWKQYVEL